MKRGVKDSNLKGAKARLATGAFLKKTTGALELRFDCSTIRLLRKNLYIENTI
jgi:hypothetical protein